MFALLHDVVSNSRAVYFDVRTVECINQSASRAAVASRAAAAVVVVVTFFGLGCVY